ncbi:MAG TPA: hypothetical protein VF097_11485 [Actinomycetota bacterium]
MTDLDRSSTTTVTRIAPGTGLAFVGLALAAALVIGQYSYLPAGDEIAAFFQENARRVQIGAYLGALSSVFLIWFSGSVRSHLRVSEGGTGRLSTVAFGGGVAGAVGTGIAFSILSVAGARGSEGQVTPATAMVLYDIYGSLIGVAVPITLAALLGASSLVALRAGALPGWLAWSGAVLTIGLISPFSYIFIAIAFLWIAVVSILLLLSSEGAITSR